MFNYNHKVSRTANAKAMVGESMRLTNYIGKMSRIPSVKEGKVVSVKGLNGDCAQVFFENGEYTYYSWDTKTEVL